ncbi:MAG: cation:proton antiporter [Chloroflexi bacterium]|nr:cation:proton antiporter [Chloroflexota bacterium]
METETARLVAHLVLQLAVILGTAKLAGELVERWLKQPGVLGELVVGIAIGPYALGALSVPGFGPLFPLPSGGEAMTVVPVSSELYSFAQVASVILLFVVGLETDLRQFLRFAGPAAVVAVGGVVAPFLLGNVATVLFGFADSYWAPEALFMGAVMTATSIGITARVLSDLRRLGTPEGVTILGAAVIDDVLGILMLTVVVSVQVAGEVSLGALGWVAVKALGFWIGLVAVGIALGPSLARLLGAFRVEGAAVAMALAIAFFAAALAEVFGLALIIGAYSIGLALSNTHLKHELEAPLRQVYYALVPVFFVVIGMMVNVPAMLGVLGFGLAITVLAILGKIVGCGLPSLGVGFNLLGAWRIGLGMLPRGEVALIIAGIGFIGGAISAEIFGVAVLMTLVTTLLATVLLVPAFRRPEAGRRV